jgi:hypothetical protein
MSFGSEKSFEIKEEERKYDEAEVKKDQVKYLTE